LWNYVETIIAEIAIQFRQLRRIKSFSSTLNRNLISHLQFSVPLFLFYSRIFSKKSIGRMSSEFAFHQRFRSRILALDLDDLSTYLSLLRPKLGSALLFLIFFHFGFCLAFLILSSFPPSLSLSLSPSHPLSSFLFLRDKSSIKYLRFACIREICGDMI